MSRSIKAVIDFVPDVFRLWQSFSFIVSNCAVRVLKWFNDFWGVWRKSTEASGSQRKPSFSFVLLLNVTELQMLFEARLRSCSPRLMGEMQSFGKVSTNFFSLFPPVLSFSLCSTFSFSDNTLPHVTLHLWRFPVLSDHSLFGSC